MNEIAKEWVNKAEIDFDAAELTLRGREAPIIDAVCFHSQLGLCLTVDRDFEALCESLQSLEQYAVLIRYPGLIVPARMAEQAFESADRIRKYLREKLGINNP